jgi:hypothetical protein
LGGGNQLANPTLPLTTEEKKTLRREQIKLSEIHSLNHTMLAKVLSIPADRAKEMKALADFQTVPSIGFQLAYKLVKHLQYFSLDEIKEKDGALLFDLLKKRLGVWTDSCVEDKRLPCRQTGESLA